MYLLPKVPKIPCIFPGILPETNMALETGWLEDEISYWDSLLSGAIPVSCIFQVSFCLFFSPLGSIVLSLGGLGMSAMAPWLEFLEFLGGFLKEGSWSSPWKITWNTYNFDQMGFLGYMNLPRWMTILTFLGCSFKDFLFLSRTLGKWSSLTHIFQMGWNYQLVEH